MIRLRPSGADEVLIKRVRDWYEPGPGVFIEPQSLFSPAMLFTGTTTGAWYDPSDINLTWRRNLLTYSEQFDNGVWSKVSSAVSVNQIAAPDGATTADFMVETATTAEHLILQSQALSWGAGSKVVGSVYAKSGGRRYIRLLIGGSNAGWNAYCVFDLIAASTGSPAANSAAIVSRSITDVGNGWYRCELVATPTVSSSSGAVIQFNTMLSMDANASNYTGDGTSGIYIWGAQLEQGSTATPYQHITDGIQDYLQYQAQPVLYRDAAGTTPVTGVEQPVGLMLDKSKGLVLGPELVTNGDFSNGTTGWVTANGGAVVNSRCECTTASNFLSTTAAILTVGKWYSAEFDYFMTAGAKLRVATKDTVGPDVATIVATSQSLVTNAVTRLKIKFQAAVGGFFILQASDATFSGWVDNISVRELPGNHAFNSSGNSANFPVLSARYNLLTKTEDFSDAVWAFANVGTGTGTKTANYGIAPDGTQTAARVQLSVGVLTDRAYFYQGIAAPASATQRWYIKTNDGSTKTITMAGIGTKQIVVTGNWQLFTASDSGSAGANPGLILGNSTPTDLSADLLVWHPDVRVSNDALNQPAYQRVNTATDYDTVGFKPYLRFNGTNQWLQTSSIDFTYGDKMFVCAGVRKLSDAAVAILVELSANLNTNSGSLYIAAPSINGVSNYAFDSKGTIEKEITSIGYASPINNVVSGIGNISAPSVVLRANGAQVAQSTASQGTGNYGNYPLYIGARAGTSLWFNGRLYGMVVAGKQASAAEITSTETYLNQKTGAY